MRGSANLLLLIACGCGDSGPKPVPVDGVEPGDYADNIVKLQRLDGSSFVEITEVRAREDGLVLFCSGVRGLNIVDASIPDRMTTVAQLVPSIGNSQFPRCQHVAYSGDTVYLTNKGDEIQPTPFIVAFDLESESEIATYTDPGTSFEGIAAVGDLLYVAAHDRGLIVLELDGSTFVPTGAVSGLENALAVAVDGSIAYVANGAGGLVVVDVADPANPVEIARVSLPGVVQSVEIDSARSLAVVAAGQGGVVVVDISTPSAPVVLGSASTPGSALQVSLDGNHAFVADWNDVRAFDLSDPSTPALAATERVDTGNAVSRVLGVAARDGIVYAGEWTGLYSLEFRPDRKSPDIWFGDSDVEFGDVASGEKQANVIILRNEGSEPLVIWEIEASSGRISVSDSQLIIAPGEVSSIEAVFDSNSTSEIAKSLFLRSDDPDEPVTELFLHANRPGIAVGDPAPEVMVELASGGQWRLSEQRGSVVLLAYFATF